MAEAKSARNAEIIRLRLEGLTLAAIATKVGLKIPRTRQVLARVERREKLRFVVIQPGEVVAVPVEILRTFKGR